MLLLLFVLSAVPCKIKKEYDLLHVPALRFMSVIRSSFKIPKFKSTGSSILSQVAAVLCNLKYSVKLKLLALKMQIL